MTNNRSTAADVLLANSSSPASPRRSWRCFHQTWPSLCSTPSPVRASSTLSSSETRCWAPRPPTFPFTPTPAAFLPPWTAVKHSVSSRVLQTLNVLPSRPSTCLALNVLIFLTSSCWNQTVNNCRLLLTSLSPVFLSHEILNLNNKMHWHQSSCWKLILILLILNYVPSSQYKKSNK